MKEVKTLAVFIGRFRPLHRGHIHVIEHALSISDSTLVLVGSANRPRTVKNPWTFEEVEEMIESKFFTRRVAKGLMVEPLNDYMHDNDFKWIAEVQSKVEEVRALVSRNEQYDVKVVLVGHSKDSSSYYLKKFPQWGSVEVPSFLVSGKELDATMIRNILLTDGEWHKNVDRARSSGFITDAMHDWLEEWGMAHPEVIESLRSELRFSKQYLEEHSYRGGLDPETGRPMGKGYAPIMTTADSVIIQSGHVLLGRRKFNPGKGLWALPGGFASPTETIRNASLRETSEETRIAMRPETLNLAFRMKQVFSDPNRGETRGRIVTHAYLYLLNDSEKLVDVKADDDFAEVRWFPIGLLDPRDLYSDHYWIIQKMIDLIPVD